MKVTINNKEYELVYNYSGLRAFENLTGISLTNLGDIELIKHGISIVKAGIIGGLFPSSYTLTDEEIEMCLNSNPKAIKNAVEELSKAILNQFVDEKNEKGAN